MAFTEFGTNDPQTRKVWSDKLMRETFGKMGIRTLISRGPEACIQLLTDLDKSPGDKITFDLLVQDRSPGVNGDARLDGFESALTYYPDELKINQKRHAHAFKGMSQQRTVHDLRKDGRFSLSEWWAWFTEASMFAHLCGVAGTGEETVVTALGADTGGVDFAGNTVTALDSAHLVNGAASNFSLDMIDDAVAKAKVQNPRVAPLNIGGKKCYVLYLHPYQVRSLRSSVGDSRWETIQVNANVRGNSNPIFTDALGMYNNVILRESEFIPRSGTNITHAIMLGQGAAALAYGNAWVKRGTGAGGGTFFNWREKEDDYGNEIGVAGISVLGVKGTQFGGEAHGRIGIRTTEAPPA